MQEKNYLKKNIKRSSRLIWIVAIVALIIIAIIWIATIREGQQLKRNEKEAVPYH